MDLCIVWEREDGGITVTHPVPNNRNVLVFNESEEIIARVTVEDVGTSEPVEGAVFARPETDEEFAQRIVIKKGLQFRPMYVSRKDALPSRKLRNAWRLLNNAIVIDTAHAREIVRDKAQSELQPRIAALIKEQFEAEDLGTPQDVERIKQKRKDTRAVLTQVEKDIEGMTWEQLENYEPTWP